MAFHVIHVGLPNNSSAFPDFFPFECGSKAPSMNHRCFWEDSGRLIPKTPRLGFDIILLPQSRKEEILGYYQVVQLKPCPPNGKVIQHLDLLQISEKETRDFLPLFGFKKNTNNQEPSSLSHAVPTPPQL